MSARTKLAVVLGSLILLAGCGGATGTTTTTKGTTGAATTTQAKSAGARAMDCITGLGFVTRPAGTATRIESPGGRMIANLRLFRHPAEARRYADQLILPHGAGPAGVAVWLKDAEGDDKATITDCLQGR